MSTPYQQHSLFGEQHPVKTAPTTQKKQHKQTAQARAACVDDCHEWHPTFTQGEQMCLRCHLRAYCPDCLGFPPRHVLLRYCLKHRKEEKR